MSQHVTLRGFVGRDPESHLFDDGTSVARFRLATTSRRFDPASGTWHDGSTSWYTVRCFRSLGMHVMASVRCGQPVVVTGRLSVNEWQSEQGPRTVVQIDATAVGHDLAFGTSNFSRAAGRSQRAGEGSDDTEQAGSSNRADTGHGGDGGDGADGSGSGPRDDAARYRSARSLGLGEDGFVDVASGALVVTEHGDDTFGGARSGEEGTNAEEGEDEKAEAAVVG